MKFFLTFCFCLFVLKVSAATYYIDYTSGSDANNGTATNTAWKHCPGDANATGTANAATPAAGDVISFRGGVVYRGMVTLKSSGTAASPIRYTGSAWDAPNAIINGGQIVGTSWTACTNAADCFGNTNFSKIWWTTVPAGATNAFDLFFESNSILPMAQYFVTNPPNNLQWGNWDTAWPTIVSNNISTNYLVDTVALVQTNSGAYSNAWVVVWLVDDAPSFSLIDSYVPATHRINFTTAELAYYPVNGTYYTIINSPAHILSAGQVAIRPDENRVYLWPPNSGNPNSQTIEYVASDGAQVGFWNIGKSNLVINGFKMVGQGSSLFSQTYAGPITNVQYLNMDISCGRSMTTHNFPAFVDDGGTMSNCVVRDTQVCGIIGSGKNLNVVSCLVSNINSWNYSGIYFLGVTGGVISNNVVTGTYGIHGNGVTSYAAGSVLATNITFANNWVYNCPSVTCISLQSTHNLYIYNNIFDNRGLNQVFSDFGGNDGVYQVFNNTIVGSYNATALFNTSTNCITVNNIIGGGYSTTRSNNIYCALSFNQNAGYGWTTNANESVITNLATLFASTNTWTLAASSPALGAGANLSAYFTTDYAGSTRTVPWTIGAYQTTNSTASGNSIIIGRIYF